MKIENINNCVLKMSVFMSEKLYLNNHKEGWSGYPPKTWFRRITQESKELRRAIDDKEKPETVWREAADIANFVMMIASCYQNQYEEPSDEL